MAPKFAQATSTPFPDGISNRYPKRKRAEVRYFDSEFSDSDLSHSEVDYAPIKKRARPTPSKPLPKHKIFPFLSLPAELRNRIYEECLLDWHIRGVEARQALYLCSKQKAYRRSVQRCYPEFNDWERNRWYALGSERRTRHYRYSRLNNSGTANSQEEEGKKLKPIIPVTLATCKQIYREAVPILYGQRLVFEDTGALASFATMLAPRNAALLRHIEITEWLTGHSRRTMGFLAMTLLAARGAVNLRRLHINSSISYFHVSYNRSNRDTPVPKRVARKVYRDCYLWLEAVGTAEMSNEGEKIKGLFAGIDVLELHRDNFGQFVRYQAKEGSYEEKLEAGKTIYRKELRKLLCEA